MESPTKTRNEKLGSTVVSAFANRGFEAFYCEKREDAVEKVMALVPKGTSVSWGGSATIQELKLPDRFHSGDYTVLDRDRASSPEERMAVMHKALGCDTFITGTNAISEDGQLVNIDGGGNRVAAMCYGPKQVIVVAGMNKVEKTIKDAFIRARTAAAPFNIQRFPDAKTPCNENGACADCLSPDSICAYIVNTRVCRPKGKIKVILIGEDLGF